jgi:hypothetical protein
MNAHIFFAPLKWLRSACVELCAIKMAAFRELCAIKMAAFRLWRTYRFAV